VLKADAVRDGLPLRRPLFSRGPNGAYQPSLEVLQKRNIVFHLTRPAALL
jgi:hypothetical protein